MKFGPESANDCYLMPAIRTRPLRVASASAILCASVRALRCPATVRHALFNRQNPPDPFDAAPLRVARRSGIAAEVAVAGAPSGRPMALVAQFNFTNSVDLSGFVVTGQIPAAAARHSIPAGCRLRQPSRECARAVQRTEGIVNHLPLCREALQRRKGHRPCLRILNARVVFHKWMLPGLTMHAWSRRGVQLIKLTTTTRFWSSAGSEITIHR
jgi:hypothetical protein